LSPCIIDAWNRRVWGDSRLSLLGCEFMESVLCFGAVALKRAA
jgi:hypothetical protein